MIVLAFFGGFLVLMIVAAMFYDRRARRRGLRPGGSEREVLKREGTSNYPSSDGGTPGALGCNGTRALACVTLRGLRAVCASSTHARLDAAAHKGRPRTRGNASWQKTGVA
jgi:hypothetical protein